MPYPRSGEHEDDYIPRCMSSDEMNSQYPDQQQRAAVCYSYWREHRKGVLTEAADHLEAASEMTEPTPREHADLRAGHQYHAAMLRSVLGDSDPQS